MTIVEMGFKCQLLLRKIEFLILAVTTFIIIVDERLNMGEIFLTADHHFGHSKILQYVKRRGDLFSSIQEHDQILIERWNSVVKPNDTVIHLGDIAFGRQGFNCIRRLNGASKQLIMGNHDILEALKYLEVFAQLHGSLLFKGVAILTHVPVHPQQLNSRFAFNLHGHLHGQGGIDDKRYIDVGVDAWDYQPVALEVLKSLIEARL